MAMDKNSATQAKPKTSKGPPAKPTKKQPEATKAASKKTK